MVFHEGQEVFVMGGGVIEAISLGKPCAVSPSLTLFAQERESSQLRSYGRPAGAN